LWSQWEQYRTLWDLDPLFNAHALLEVTLKALPAILRGERKATEVLFPHSSTALVENVYKHNPVSGYYNRVIGEMVASYVVQRQHSRPSPIRILEIGAGTGSATSAVLDRLSSHPEAVAEYCYTDISKAFLTHAQKEYGPSHPFLVYRLFDVEKPVANQQIETGVYDLVLASNVLHATRNVRNALRNAKALLKRKGLLLLNEITGANLFGHVTFGLLEGWWLYDDEPLRIDGCPGVAPQTWNWLLQAEGFHSVQFPAEESHSSGQQIVMAESDGVIRQPLRQPKPAVPARRKSPAAISSPGGCTNPIDRLTAILSELLSIPAAEFDIKIPLDRYGLDSIVTLEFCRELRPEFGEISPGSIFEHRTIQALASFLGAVPQDAEIRRLPRELLLLDSGRPGIRDNRVPASVWVHGAPGYAQGFRALAKNSEYPIYAFQARGVDGDSLPFSDLGAMADYYFKCLESEVPGSPLVLGGYSLGGVIALEVARRWSAAGHTVAHLVLLDTYPKTPEVEHVFSSLRDEGFYQVLLANMFLAARGYEPVPLTEADLAGVPASLRLGELARLVSRRNENRVSEDDVYRALLGTTAVSNFTGEAFRKFHIEPYAASDVSFVRARRGFILPAEDKLPALASEFRSFDYIEPWRRLIRTSLAVHTIDTDHFSLLGSEGAPEVRNLLAAIMQEIEIRSTGSGTLARAADNIYEEAASSAVTQ
jgi:thioesterase domain-containing protein/SAM-dependent methyltransferase